MTWLKARWDGHKNEARMGREGMGWDGTGGALFCYLFFFFSPHGLSKSRSKYALFFASSQRGLIPYASEGKGHHTTFQPRLVEDRVSFECVHHQPPGPGILEETLAAFKQILERY